MVQKSIYFITITVLLSAISEISTNEGSIFVHGNFIEPSSNASERVPDAIDYVTESPQTFNEVATAIQIGKQNYLYGTSVQQNTKGKKPIYDGTKYKNKNQKNEDIFPKISILYINQLLDNRHEINLNRLEKIAQQLPQTEVPIILDIEIWDVHTANDVEANKNIDKYILVIDTLKKIRPDLKFGYYGVLPNRDYWSPITNDPRKIQDWNRINKRLRKLAEHVDVICPSLYTFYDDFKGWKKYAIENIRRAHEYGKPVYPFLWPQYHDSNNVLGGKFLPSTIWQEQLTLVYDNADGIIIWGGWDMRKEFYGKMNWNENDLWWHITKEFILNNEL